MYTRNLPISKAIEEGDFFRNKALLTAVDSVKKHGSKLHLMGLVSDGGVHSHMEHLYALVELAKSRGLEQVYIHCFMDGRDVPPSSGKSYIEMLEKKLQYEFGKKPTVSGVIMQWIVTNGGSYQLLMMPWFWAENSLHRGAAMEQSYTESVTDNLLSPRLCLRMEAGATIGK